MEVEINDFECSICLDVVENNDFVKLINCKHIFHKSCIDEWQKINNTCPLCRKNISNYYRVKTSSYFRKINNIAEIKENCVIIYKTNKNIEEIGIENIRNQEVNFILEYFKVKTMKVEKNCIKIYYMELTNNKFKVKTRHIYLSDYREAINFFNTIKENILQFHRKIQRLTN
tara:strand:+ start:904 stop:1419 length:516 start_codon:yes stop_codon:yes gene_type:complete